MWRCSQHHQFCGCEDSSQIVWNNTKCIKCKPISELPLNIHTCCKPVSTTCLTDQAIWVKLNAIKMNAACTDNASTECHTQLNKLDIDLGSGIGVRTSVACSVRHLHLFPLGLNLVWRRLRSASSCDLTERPFLLLTRGEWQEFTLRVWNESW